MVTDARWLRMTALFDLGTKPSYKKEIIADNLEEFVNSRMCLAFSDTLE
jgi:hypothetical protein